MSFNPDRNKQAQEVIFSRKCRKGFHSNLCFNDQSIERSVTHKHVEVTLHKNCRLVIASKIKSIKP